MQTYVKRAWFWQGNARDGIAAKVESLLLSHASAKPQRSPRLSFFGGFGLLPCVSHSFEFLAFFSVITNSHEEYIPACSFALNILPRLGQPHPCDHSGSVGDVAGVA